MGLLGLLAAGVGSVFIAVVVVVVVTDVAQKGVCSHLHHVGEILGGQGGGGALHPGLQGRDGGEVEWGSRRWKRGQGDFRANYYASSTILTAPQSSPHHPPHHPPHKTQGGSDVTPPHPHPPAQPQTPPQPPPDW